MKFDLDDAHPDYQRDIPAILTPLIRCYSRVKLGSVALYHPSRGDTSMGVTKSDGSIELNSYWFSRDPSELNKASHHQHLIEVNGIPMGWHGPMVWEPRQVLTHEFGHAAWYSLPQHLIEQWAGNRWSAATRAPHTAPSAYALMNREEWFGEMFALVHLGLATDDEVDELSTLLECLR